MNPLLLVLHRLGGSGTNDDMRDGVVEILRLTDEQATLLHDPDRGQQTELEYRLSLARRYLKKYGLLDNPKPKTWKLTAKGSTVVRRKSVCGYFALSRENLGREYAKR